MDQRQYKGRKEDMEVISEVNSGGDPLVSVLREAAVVLVDHRTGC